MNAEAASRSGGLQTADRTRGAVWKTPLLGLLITLSFVPKLSCFAEPILIGSKKFTESYVLAEIAKRSFENAGLTTDHRQGMGGTIILWQALRSGQIAVYPEYTGTIAEEILKTPTVSESQMREELAKLGVGMTGEIGFNNTYALV